VREICERELQRESVEEGRELQAYLFAETQFEEREDDLVE